MAVPSVKAGTTAEETIQCWCTVEERREPRILIYSRSLVTMHSIHMNTLRENVVWISRHLLEGVN